MSAGRWICRSPAYVLRTQVPAEAAVQLRDDDAGRARLAGLLQHGDDGWACEEIHGDGAQIGRAHV